MADKSDVKATLNLPRTDFAMKASLAQKEPETLKAWEADRLYARILEKRAAAGRPPFILHDGPPYANGNIHMGTALNKILKDFIVKSRTMLGYDAPYVPGWDCHGLPIEIHVDKQLGGRRRTCRSWPIREECREYAEKFIDIQRGEFKRLGVLGDWEKPYLTMDPAYEAKILRLPGRLLRARASVFKGKRPGPLVHPLPDRPGRGRDRVQGQDLALDLRQVPGRLGPGAKFPALAGRTASVVIWTTTPWTLPANLAIAFHPESEYAACEAGGEVYIAGQAAVARRGRGPRLGRLPRSWPTFPGGARGPQGPPSLRRPRLALRPGRLRHPGGRHRLRPHRPRPRPRRLPDRPGLRPRHLRAGRRRGPVHAGRSTATPASRSSRPTPHHRRHEAGRHAPQGDPITPLLPPLLALQEPGHLPGHRAVVHLHGQGRAAAAAAARPSTGSAGSRLGRGAHRRHDGRPARLVHLAPAVLGRADPGLRLPGLRRAAGRRRPIARHVAGDLRPGGLERLVRPATPPSSCPPGTVCPDCGGTDFEKEANILDVWFESGARHNVLEREPAHAWPADVYIEGHDQHRGWFNSSLAHRRRGQGRRRPTGPASPTASSWTSKGRAMSKSLGNVIEPGAVIARGGAEILRLWVAMLNYKEDARFGAEIEQRVRRGLPQDPQHLALPARQPLRLRPRPRRRPGGGDGRARPLGPAPLRRGRAAHAQGATTTSNIHVVFHALLKFFTVDLSAFYLDVLKDRLYCSAKASRPRRSAQTAMFRILREILLLMAPILPFTAEEAWDAAAGLRRAGRLGPSGRSSPGSTGLDSGTAEAADWEALLAVRETVLKELENARERKVIGNALEARVPLSRRAGDWPVPRAPRGRPGFACSSSRMSSSKPAPAKSSKPSSRRAGRQVRAVLDLFGVPSGRARTTLSFAAAATTSSRGAAGDEGTARTSGGRAPGRPGPGYQGSGRSPHRPALRIGPGHPRLLQPDPHPQQGGHLRPFQQLGQPLILAPGACRLAHGPGLRRVLLPQDARPRRSS